MTTLLILRTQYQR